VTSIRASVPPVRASWSFNHVTSLRSSPVPSRPPQPELTRRHSRPANLFPAQQIPAEELHHRQDFATVRYIDTGGDEHYAGLAEAASVPFENGRMARSVPAHRDIAHTPGRYWAATTGELVEFESHLEEKWLTWLDFDAGITGFSSQPMELESADEHGPWSHVPDIFARRADGLTASGATPVAERTASRSMMDIEMP
jgi:hypothetical protein